MRAYLFDLDGTLLDTETVWCAAVAQWLAAKGRPLGADEASALVYGRSWRDIHADVCARFPEIARDAEMMEIEAAGFFHAARAAADVRIPGSIALLKRLAAAAPCCIVSGSPRRHIAEAVEIMGCAGDLRFYLGAEDYAPGKPSPACFLLAAERLGAAPSDCVVFEDSAAGVAAGKTAGMRVVALSRPCRPRQDVSAADLTLADLSDYTEA